MARGVTISNSPESTTTVVVRSKESPYQSFKHTFSVKPRQFVTRAKAPKVRTGCLTCKKRHVKCDEGKPSCARCLKWKGVCEGYDPSAAKLKDDSSSDEGTFGNQFQRNARSQSTSSSSEEEPSALALTPRKKKTALSLLLDLNNSPFRSQCESNYFNAWVKISSKVGGGFLKDLYTTTITQYGFQDPAVREAIMAVGSLNCALQETPDPCALRHNPHYRNALAKYGSALRRISSRSVDDNSLRTVMLCCTLFICFETLDCNRWSVHNHIAHGSKILRQFLSSIAPGASLNCCTKSPSPYVLDDMIIQLFQRLDYLSWQQLAYQVSKPTTEIPGSTGVEDISLEKARYIIEHLPEEFTEAEAASRWLDLMTKGGIDAFRCGFIRRDDAYKQGNIEYDLLYDQRWHADRELLLSALRGWRKAFQPLMAKAEARQVEDPEAFSRAIGLHLQYLMVDIAIDTSHMRDFQILNAATPKFREFVSYSERLFSLSKYEGEVIPCTINGAVFPLMTTATKCRDPSVRADAERLLRENPRNEGLWSTQAAVKIIDWLKVVEAEYETAFGDPETVWSYMRDRYVKFDERENVAIGGAARLDRETGQWRIREQVLRW